MKTEIIKLMKEVHPYYISIPEISPISTTVIYAEYDDLSNIMVRCSHSQELNQE